MVSFYLGAIGLGGVEMPITAQMVEVLYHGKAPGHAVAELIMRQLKDEVGP